MTNIAGTTRIRFRFAVGAALAMMLASGLVFRMLEAHYARASESIPIPRGTLAGLPLYLGRWSGRDVPLNPRIVERTDADDYVNRTYVRDDAGPSVSLFIAYGVRLRDLAPHRPEVCYRGAGWTLEDTRHGELTAANGAVVPYELQRFRRGGLGAQAIAVLHYYLVDGEYAADVSLLRSRASRGDASARYAVQVQAAVARSPFHDESESQLRDFAAVSAPEIRNALVAAVRKLATSRKAATADAP